SCFEVKTGKPVYEKERLGGSFTASPWSYGGKVFCLSEEGTTYVVRAGAEFELLGKNVLGEVALATPAVADGRLVLRTATTLYCVKKPCPARRPGRISPSPAAARRAGRAGRPRPPGRRRPPATASGPCPPRPWP